MVGVLVPCASRAVLMLIASNQALVRATDEAALLGEICRIAVETGYRMAWVGFTEHDDPNTVRPAAQAGFEPGYLESLTLTWTDQAHGRGPTAEPAFRPQHARVELPEYQPSLALPLRSEDNTFGVLCLYAAEVDAFDAEEMQTLTELANDLVFGLTVLRANAKRDRATEALRRQTEELNQVLASVSDYLWSAKIDAHGRWCYRFCSPVVEKITGRRPEFYLATNAERWLDIVHPEDQPRVRDVLSRVAARTSMREEEEYRIVRPDGSVRWVRDSVTVAPLEAGRIRVDGVVSDITERKRAEASFEKVSEGQELKAMLRDIAGTLADLAGRPVLRSLPPELLKNLRNLSHREGEILQALLRNQRVLQIANTLYISPHTVRNHLASIFRKLGVGSQSELLSLFRGFESPAISGPFGDRPPRTE